MLKLGVDVSPRPLPTGALECIKDELTCLGMKTLKSPSSYSAAAAIKVHYRVITVRSIVVRSQA